MDSGWRETYEELVKFLNEHDPSRTFNLRGEDLATFTKLKEELKERFVNCVLGEGDLRAAYSWIKVFNEGIEGLKDRLRLRGLLLSKELKSFVEDPKAHLKKKIFLYIHDLLRGKMGVEEFERSAGAAIRTSLRTNMRSVYQDWVLVSLLKGLAFKGAKMVYPEYGYLSLDRAGKQRGGGIPPNLILWLNGGYLSFFLEAPRPVGWEDGRELRRAWSLYVALRPDILVYAGRVLNIVKIGANPPIKRPDIIIECKELEDWYMRSRDMRGPFAKPLTAEEWRSRWLKGLYRGLADALGVKEKDVREAVESKKSIRVREPRLVCLYKALYSPKHLILICRAEVPDQVKSDLEGEGIEVFDGVSFEERKLNEVVELLSEEASRVKEGGPLILEGEVARLAYELSLKTGKPPIEAVKSALIKALKEEGGAPAGI